MLDEPWYLAGAGRIAQDYARNDAPAEAVALLELLAATGHPVIRDGAAKALRPAEPAGVSQ